MSAIQFNLLPDIKLDYIKTQRTRKFVISLAVLVSAVTIGLFLLLLTTVNVVQKKQLTDANNDVQAASNELENISGLNKVLTVQSQLSSLPSLHSNKHITSRIFTYLPEVTPTSVHVGNLSLDFSNNTMQIDGTADSPASINVFIDTLKYATYKTSDQDSSHTAFPSVIENSFTVTPGSVSYSLAVQFDPQLFSNTVKKTPQLTVQNQITTRSVIDDPNNNLFNGQTTTKKAGQ